MSTLRGIRGAVVEKSGPVPVPKMQGTNLDYLGNLVS
jgi:hypothetical protein